jgi:hypothetical protein
MLAGCGGQEPLTPERVADRFREETGIVLELQAGHAEEEGHEEKGPEEGETFLEPKRLTRADVARYGRFTLVFWPGKNPLVHGAWNHDFRGWTHQSTHGSVTLLWRAGRTRRLDARWRTLDALVGEISGVRAAAEPDQRSPTPIPY